MRSRRIGEAEEILAEFLLGDPVWLLVVVFGQLADGTQVRLLGFLGHAAELHVLEHAFSELRCDVPPLKERIREPSSRSISGGTGVGVL